MPVDRLSDALRNSEPHRHRLRCRHCGYVVKAASALGARWAMRRHRKSMHKQGR